MSSGGKNSDGYEYEYVPAAMCFNEKATTPFADLNMDQMKAMVIDAKPEQVHDVARGWRNVNNELVGEDGRGGSRQDLLAAVNAVLEHWEGEAADAFKAQAEVIAQKMQDGAKYAQYTSTALGSAATVLEAIKPEVEAMEKPGTMSSAGDFLADGFSHDDSGYQADKQAGMSTQEALDKNHDDLSAGKEAQLKMAVKMEQLGAAYASQTKAMGSWNRTPPVRRDDGADYPGDPGGIVPTPIVAIPTESGPRLVGRTSAGSGASSGSGRSTITTSPSSPKHVAGTSAGSSSKVSAPSGVATDVDGLATTSSRGAGAGAGDGGGFEGGGGTRAGGTGGGSGTGTGFPGASGGSASGSARGGAASGARSVAGNGRTGMGGGGAGAGAGAGRGKQPGGRGPLARTKGGVVGESGGTPSTGARAGSGLHGSRGGTTEGRKAAGLSGSGQAGAAGKGRDKKKTDGKPIPDYLVEDEETWVPKRDDTTPRVIE